MWGVRPIGNADPQLGTTDAITMASGLKIRLVLVLKFVTRWGLDGGLHAAARGHAVTRLGSCRRALGP